ncbi:hypothetical protein EYC84_001264 [Monilinia fructicola]|uniref:Uncharacterized protein n=1 Tax=Monilinia fructicola TaxID=38448 RepID=A0A5M9JRV0_MONFR|nr:hypothetical protein EYC84_001264 [Monilinia fructicola]
MSDATSDETLKQNRSSDSNLPRLQYETLSPRRLSNLVTYVTIYHPISPYTLSILLCAHLQSHTLPSHIVTSHPIPSHSIGIPPLTLHQTSLPPNRLSPLHTPLCSPCSHSAQPKPQMTPPPSSPSHPQCLRAYTHTMAFILCFSSSHQAPTHNQLSGTNHRTAQGVPTYVSDLIICSHQAPVLDSCRVGLCCGGMASDRTPRCHLDITSRAASRPITSKSRSPMASYLASHSSSSSISALLSFAIFPIPAPPPHPQVHFQSQAKQSIAKQSKAKQAKPHPIHNPTKANHPLLAPPQKEHKRPHRSPWGISDSSSSPPSIPPSIQIPLSQNLQINSAAPLALAPTLAFPPSLPTPAFP